MRPSRPKRPPISAEHGRFTTSAVTVAVAEILYGLRRIGSEDRVALFEASLADADVLPFDDDAARLAGRINADLERAGRIIGLPDVMIAAIAIRSGLAIVTGNTAHFEHVRTAKYDLRIDNWRMPCARSRGSGRESHVAYSARG